METLARTVNGLTPQQRLVALAALISLSVYFGFWRWKVGCSDAACAVYTVRPGPRAKERADILARINADIQKVLLSLEPDPRVARIRSRFSGIRESLSSETYTVMKHVMYLCFSTQTSYNTLIFVVLHELAHMASNSFGHAREFQTNFRWLVDGARAIGVYQFVDYRVSPEKYCGMTISTTA